MKSIGRMFPFAVFLLVGGTQAAEPWPAEANTAAVQLTAIDSGLNAAN